MADEGQRVSRGSPLVEENLQNNGERTERRKYTRKKRLLKETDNAEEKEEVSRQGSPKEIQEANDGRSESRKNKRKEQNLKEDAEVNMTSCLKEGESESNYERVDIKTNKRKKRLLKEATDADKRGICYLSRIPPHMDPLKIRQILSQYGEIQRIYLMPEDPAPRPHRRRDRKQDGKFKDQGFSEGWVEFTKKGVAKRVANMLNGEQIGGKKRSAFYYDLWNIKYLSKFKWDDLTGEIAYKNAIREQKLALEISAAKRERDFYLSKVDRSRALGFIEERLKEKKKVQQESGLDSRLPVSMQSSNVIRQFPQTKPVVADNAAQSKPQLSKDILAGVFGGSH